MSATPFLACAATSVIFAACSAADEKREDQARSPAQVADFLLKKVP